MEKKKYTVDHLEDVRAELESFVSHGKRSAQAITRARILLRADEGVSDPEITEDQQALDTHSIIDELQGKQTTLDASCG